MTSKKKNTGVKFTLGSARALGQLFRDYYNDRKRQQYKTNLLTANLPLPWFGHVTGVEKDPNTGSKVVAVRRILSFMPYDYDHEPGAEVYAWAGFDSLVSVGHFVKVTYMSAPIDEPYRLFAELIVSARQDTLPYPDATCIATMLAPCVPTNPSSTCLLMPVT